MTESRSGYEHAVSEHRKMRVMQLRLAVVWLGAIAITAVSCGARHPARPTTGAVAGLARDRDTGDAVTFATIRVGTRTTKTDADGMFDVDRLPPGRYDLDAEFAGQPIHVRNIDVTAGGATAVDLVFTLGEPHPISLDWQHPEAAAIRRYRPKNLASTVARVEGTVSDTLTKQRVIGAVVTASAGGSAVGVQQTVTDDQGRFVFAAVEPGVYEVSAYYAVSGRGQIEVLRNSIHVEGGEAVFVPLWLELTR